ncbi:hypothetical protein N0V93_010335 [Gnomoniopsis smithogilvyi]|uniref:Uncharacterized protein n=1 Tax=Gnomoniopsis smithogilvyi TaxID=1191159 RepID=A0A9W9CRQ3_9PEZI|nr:hypothetical protein N0V93_010335 [Gnomoniopsis smithogilvyi]
MVFPEEPEALEESAMSAPAATLRPSSFAADQTDDRSYHDDEATATPEEQEVLQDSRLRFLEMEKQVLSAKGQDRVSADNVRTSVDKLKEAWKIRLRLPITLSRF